MRHEITQQVTATARNDAAPGLRVAFERVALEGINHITDLNGDGHRGASFMSLLMSPNGRASLAKLNVPKSFISWADFANAASADRCKAEPTLTRFTPASS